MHLRRKCIFAAFWWNVLKLSVMSIWSIVSFKACVSLFIFFLGDLSIGVSGVLKSPTIIVLLSISPFMAVCICLMYCSYVVCINIYNCYVFFLE